MAQCNSTSPPETGGNPLFPLTPEAVRALRAMSGAAEEVVAKRPGGDDPVPDQA